MHLFCVFLLVMAAASGAPTLDKLLGVKKAIKEHLFGGHEAYERRSYTGYGHHAQMADGYVPNGYTGGALPGRHHLVSSGYGGGATVSNPQIVYVQNGDRRVPVVGRGDHNGFYGYPQPHYNGDVHHSGHGHSGGGHHYVGGGGGGGGGGDAAASSSSWSQTHGHGNGGAGSGAESHSWSTGNAGYG